MEIYDLKDIPQEKMSLVGGKAKGLHLLAKAGIHIAPGFVITGLQNEEDLTNASHHFKNSGFQKVAVRSSANNEDGTDFSNAGQYKTFLNVSDEEDFKKSVKECILSLHSKEAESYSTFFQGANSSEMSVVVQEMVPAVKAGVCFTVDPSGAKDSILVEAVNGLGESLVSGQATAAQYKVHQEQLLNGSRQSLISEKSSLLQNDELLTICSEAMKASHFFEMPLDTEWVIDPNGKLVWLQARPITSLDEPDIHELDPDWDLSAQVHTTCNISEMMPGAVTPLTISTSVYAIDWGLRKMMVTSGVCKDIEEIPEWRCAFSIGNHLFLNLSSICKLEDYVLGCTQTAIELSLCGRVLEDDDKPAHNSQKQVGKVRAAINGMKYGRFILSRKKARKKLNLLANSFLIPETKDAKTQFSHIDSALNDINQAFLYHYVTSAHSGAMSSALNIMLTEEIGDKEKVKSLIAGALENIDGIESVDILRSLRRIVTALVEELPEEQLDSKELIIKHLKESSGASHQAYLYFMERHGHRAILEAEISSKGWADDEEGFIAYLMAILPSRGIEPEKNNQDYHPFKEIDTVYSGLKRKIAHYLINQARAGVVNREASKSAIIRVMNQLKKSYRYLAALLVQEGVIPDPDLIFFLRHYEIGLLIHDNDVALVKRALQRKRLYAEQKELVFKDVYYDRPKPETIDYSTMESGAVLKGNPISRGIAKGKARVVKSIDDANQLQKGEIMVAAFTDIGWSPYYCKIEALVTEVGSVLSHGAVVAREYALPLVTNVKNATRLIKTGDQITVNGTTGEVIIER